MADNSRILVLEGPLSEDLSAALGEAGWPVTRASDTPQVLSEAEDAKLIILDVLAPGMSLEFYRELEQRVEAAVLVIMPALETDDQVAALQAPFDRDVLLKRVGELAGETQPDVVQIGDLVIDLRTRQVRLHGRRVPLSKTEFDVLAYLARQRGEVVTYDELLKAVWGYPAGRGDRKLVTNSVGRVRRKLGEDSANPEYVVNVRGVGYRLRNEEQWVKAVKRGR